MRRNISALIASFPIASFLFATTTILLPSVAAAEETSVEAGYQHFYNLEYDQALTIFRANAIKNPNSPEALNHVAQTILYREMFRTGALETQMVTGNNPFLRRAEMKISAADEKEFLDSRAARSLFRKRAWRKIPTT